jgi:hypothetical protein
MKRSVPTLLGAFALIVVATLAVLVYNIRLADKLAQGLTPSGTVGGQVLTGVDAPTEVLAPRPADTATGGARPVVMLPANAGRGQAAHSRGNGGRLGQAGSGRRGGPGRAGELRRQAHSRTPSGTR